VNPSKRSDESYSDKEAERRATDALRRALSTPYKPQSEMKVGPAKKAKAKKVRKASPKSA
jgi:hypothetical protein